MKREPDHVRTNNILAAAADRIATNFTILARDAFEDGNTGEAKRLQHDALAIGERNLQITQKILRLQPDEVLNAALLNAATFNYGTYQFETGEYERALVNQTAAERGFLDELENDKSNLENKLLLGSVLTAISTTHMRLGHTGEARKLHRQAVTIFDELIASDAENFDYRQKRWEAKFVFADELLRLGEVESARQIYQNASAEIDKIAHDKDPGYGESMRGFYLERLGNADAVLLRSGRLSPAERRKLLDDASHNYLQALELWRANGAQSILGIKQPSKLGVLERKLVRIRDV